MQTFITDFSFFDTARTLDNKRLGKQRVEAMQILKILTGETKPGKNGKVAWENHPAVKMWRGYERELALYGAAICCTWIDRGFKDTLFDTFVLLLTKLKPVRRPDWINEEFINSHRAALLAKNPEWYSQFNWDVEPKIEYIWPVK